MRDREPDFTGDELAVAVPSIDNYVVRDPTTFALGQNNSLGLSYKQMMIKMVEKCLADTDAMPEGPGLAMQLIWLCFDAFAEDITPINDIVIPMLDLIWNYVNKGTKLAMNTKKNIAKIFLTVLYAAPIPFLQYLESKQLSTRAFKDFCLNLSILDSQFVAPSLTSAGSKQLALEFRRVLILSFVKLLLLDSQEVAGGRKRILPACLHGEESNLIKLLADQVLKYLQLKSSNTPDSNDSSSTDSEQTLDDNDDAQAVSILGRRLVPADDLDDDADYEDINENDDDGEDDDDDNDDYTYAGL